MLNFYPYQYYEHIREILPVVGRIYYEFVKAGISFDSAACFPLQSRLGNSRVACGASMHSFTKETLSGEQWQALFEDLLSNLDNYISIYCDGSVRGGRAGCRVFSITFKLKTRLSDKCSIVTVELSAIYYAIVFLSNYPNKCIILTESLSAIAMINEIDSKHYMVHKI